jgi:tartrate dehydrogenase/decarboxylase/D-malate dehydrogenase
MMLDHLGHTDAGALVLEAIETVTEAGLVLTPDLAGKATTEQVGQAVRKQVCALGH